MAGLNGRLLLLALLCAAAAGSTAAGVPRWPARWPLPGRPTPPAAGEPHAAAGEGCPNFQTGVLAMHNRLRASHGAPPLSWDAGLAAAAQKHADTCKLRGHASGRELAGSGESIYSSRNARYPFRGMDVCSWATHALHLEVTVYNFDAPGKTRDPSVVIGHFVNLVWAGTTKLGCGHAACPGGMNYVVCRFNPGFYNSGGSKPGQIAYGSNIKRTACMAATKDDWCSACDGATCTACYERPQYGQASGRNKIELEPASKKCLSACPGSVKNCAGCTFKGRCAKCLKGWKRDAAGGCSVPKSRRFA